MIFPAFLLAWALLPLARWLLSGWGFRVAMRGFGVSFQGSQGVGGDAVPLCDVMNRTVRRAGRCWPFLKLDCLPRSLVLYRLLRWFGLPAVFCLGAYVDVHPFAAHAWVCVGGRAIGERAETLDRLVLLQEREAYRAMAGGVD